MSYCRFSDTSEVYMFPIDDNTIQCCGCSLKPGFDIVAFKTKRGALDHLQEHINMGHKVPESAIVRLLEEMKENNAL